MTARDGTVCAFVLILVAGAGLHLAGLSGSFTGHMTFHVLLVAVAAPLLAPLVIRQCAGFRLTRWLLTAPIAVSLVEFAVVWFWHAPAAHKFAAAHGVALVIEHSSFLAAGTMVWASALSSTRYAGAGGALGGALALLMTSMHMTLLGALIGLAGRPLYEHGAHSAVTGFGMTVLEDQQFGAVVMLTVGGASYLVGGVLLMARLLAVKHTGSDSVNFLERPR